MPIGPATNTKARQEDLIDPGLQQYGTDDPLQPYASCRDAGSLASGSKSLGPNPQTPQRLEV